MVADDRKNVKSKFHNVLIENREKITINGVDDVESFDDNNVMLVVDEELLIIKGFDLKINKINTETGEVFIEGQVYSLEYGEPPKKGLIGRLFK
ncbi:hypothetical protein ELD05_03045 [Caldicellulosiruptor changbaiensis]|uniref:YabP family protein n=2 Tax=Caldicellulosiruptor TaxID=44000 RepID=A4XIT4_CALS8|nr:MULTISPECIES: YabP/YqfC family sporulation protein [Caldicellulosiruptor]ABP66819.1 YabP family protein [Caldicellulosiruptor saccharolyticus DSM 8903]AZT89713.1 hypothetical protein ELD05_03045 [Caldicellulosiruptor changbaiensis]